MIRCLHSLVCRCPFVGETDRATLLRVGEGTLNWDAPDVTCRSPEAQNFLHMLLQPDPEYECLILANSLSHTECGT